MSFIINPEHLPRDPEWYKRYKPDLQGCPECNGGRLAAAELPTFEVQVLTCNGVKIVKTTKPEFDPVVNREMDKQQLVASGDFKQKRVTNRSTRGVEDIEIVII